MRAASGSPPASTVYVGSLAEYLVRTSTTWRKYYTFAGRLVADNDGVWNYLQSDQEGTAQAQVSATGAGESASLRLPYGSTRYGASTFMGDLGYTGQRKDSTPNLVYFNARYYDQDVGVFTSADTYAAGGLNRYAYVGGNPETRTDPSGHMMYVGVDCVGCQVSSSNGGSGGDTSPITIKFVAQNAEATDSVAGGMMGYFTNIAKARYLRLANISDLHVSYLSKGTMTRIRLGRATTRALTNEAKADFEAADGFGRLLIGIGFGIDLTATAWDEYNSDTSDPTGLRIEKAAIAGTAHAAISTGFAVAFASAVALIPGVGESGIAEVAAGAFGGWVGGQLADALVTPQTVDWATNAINAGVSAVGSAASNVGGAIGSAASAVGSFFSGFGL